MDRIQPMRNSVSEYNRQQKSSTESSRRPKMQRLNRKLKRNMKRNVVAHVKNTMTNFLSLTNMTLKFVRPFILTGVSCFISRYSLNNIRIRNDRQLL